ncbi:tetratricopeptide repeat protein [Clostridium peptidivorans]|uniref:tetratricopeptide repeat protein n=1 Tax=Clostridium peptidivorans TaxID=100174 RepID=UPI000BE29E7B|nr:tetratricopeptide repeat protein [Clostridium peptidivorans]
MNFDYEIEKINPINISSEEFNSNEIPSNVRKSIALYNKSIINLKLKCVDLVITDLKKSLSLNPDFCEAIKFLGLCYVYTKDFNKAEKTFKKLAKYNIYTKLANEYLQELNAERTISKALDTIKGASSNSDNNRSKIKKASNVSKKCISSFLIAVIIIAISGLAYWNRSNIQGMFSKTENTEINKNKELEQQKAINEKYNKINEENKKVNEENNKINEENKKLQKDLETTKLEFDNYKNKNNIKNNIENKNNIISMLSDAEKSYAEGNYEKALNNLITLKSLKLDDTEKSRLDKLWNNIKTNHVWTIYNEANKLYKQGKYQEALPKLIMVQKIAPELDIMPWVLYQIGTCYKQANDNKNALVFFEKVKKDYPNTEYAGYSEGMINQIK